MKKIKNSMTLAAICAMSFGTAFAVSEKQSNEAQAWAGIGYYAAKNGASAETGFAISAIGAWEGTIQGAAWAAAFGGPVGLGVGLAVGL